MEEEPRVRGHLAMEEEPRQREQEPWQREEEPWRREEEP